MRIKKVSQVAGTVGGIVNSTSTSSNDAYSCSYINNKLEDTNGTLVDGKIKYRKIGKLVVISTNWWGSLAVASFDATLLATLPENYRPTHELDFPIYCKNTTNVAQPNFFGQILANGSIEIRNGGSEAQTIGAISFQISFFIE